MARFPIQGFQWIFYIWGWITGAGNLLFWLLMVILHFASHDHDFFGPQFHRRVYYWGVVMFIISIVTLLIVIAALAFFIPVAVLTNGYA